MTLQTILQTLTGSSAPAGFEFQASETLSGVLKNIGCEVRRDRLGSLLAVRRCGIQNLICE